MTLAKLTIPMMLTQVENLFSSFALSLWTLLRLQALKPSFAK